MPSRQECLHSPGFGAPSSSLPPMVRYELLPNLRAYTQSPMPKVKAESSLRRSMRRPNSEMVKGEEKRLLPLQQALGRGLIGDEPVDQPTDQRPGQGLGLGRSHGGADDEALGR